MLMYEFEMTAPHALKVLRRNGLVSREDARLMRSLLMGESRSLPERLYPLLEMLFLVQTKPPTPSLH